MRPVDRGSPPPLAYSKYQDAAPLLINKLGCYCSYCERQIETHLAVEHIQPKSLNAGLLLDWNNFLLGCAHCNSSKGDTSVNLDDYLWPDTDNTLLGFQYHVGGIVSPASALPDFIEKKVRAMIMLVGLDKDHGNRDKARHPSVSDNRWSHRRQTWDLAQKAKCDLQRRDNNEVREWIVETAINRGGFSIWFTILGDDKDMRLRLINAFTGTATNCFDQNGVPTPRHDGLI